MFTRARLKLTLWYLLIIMVISLSFSGAIYKIVFSELDRVEKMQKYRIEQGKSLRLRLFPPSEDPERPAFILLDPDLVKETKNRFIISLVIINGFILAVSAVTGYFLAGRTLEPIKEMVDEQNRFLGDASHELRTPLTSLKSGIEVNLRDKNLNLQDAKLLLQSNLEEVNHLQTLSDHLLKLTQYQKGNLTLPLTEISLLAISNEAIKKVTGLSKNKNILIKQEVNDFTLTGNKNTLVEMLVIFLDNAIKYSPHKSTITLLAKKTDGKIIISVRDEGQGISAKDLPHIFDRFYRSDKSRTKNDTDGYGLGLSIAKEIVERHQGHITIKSKVGKGTTVEVTLPVKQHLVI